MRGLKNYKDEKGWLIDTCLNAQERYKFSYEKLIGNLYANGIKKVQTKLTENKTTDEKDE